MAYKQLGECTLVSHISISLLFVRCLLECNDTNHMISKLDKNPKSTLIHLITIQKCTLHYYTRHYCYYKSPLWVFKIYFQENSINGNVNEKVFLNHIRVKIIFLAYSNMNIIIPTLFIILTKILWCLGDIVYTQVMT